MKKPKLADRIVTDEKICGGLPCIKGTRIFVSIILDALAEGLNHDEIISHYPTLSHEDIYAAIAYAAEMVRENVWKVSVS